MKAGLLVALFAVLATCSDRPTQPSEATIITLSGRVTKGEAPDEGIPGAAVRVEVKPGLGGSSVVRQTDQEGYFGLTYPIFCLSGDTRRAIASKLHREIAEFSIECTSRPQEFDLLLWPAGPGEMVVETRTSADGRLPSESYAFAVQGPEPADYTVREIGPNDQRIFDISTVGVHIVTLQDVPPNCGVDGGASREVDHEIASITYVVFEVSCTAESPA